jgi:lysophospholipase L1-like esterase
MKELNKKFVRGTAYLHRFHGEKAHNLKQYVPIHINQEKSDSIVVIGGGNDLDSDETILEIANHLIEAGTNGKNLGATKVGISSILPRADFHQQLKRHQLNKLLKELCLANGFEYIDNSNIRLDTHILSDGVHLNISGTRVLQSNILRHLNS